MQQFNQMIQPHWKMHHKITKIYRNCCLGLSLIAWPSLIFYYLILGKNADTFKLYQAGAGCIFAILMCMILDNLLTILENESQTKP